MQAGIQQLCTETVVGGAAERGAGQGFQAAVAGPLGLDAGRATEGFRDVLGDEVNHAADVLRPVTHRATAAHHVNRLQAANRQRCHRQLWLTVRRDRQGDAVHQNGGAR